MKHIFGPVPSRRLGSSLGVDIVPFKTCSYDCIYCQLSQTTCKTTERKEYIDSRAIISDLKAVLNEFDAPKSSIDYITFSGSGEPTLNSAIGKIISSIKASTDLPVAVLTNGSLLYRDELRKDLCRADLVIPSLDAVTQHVFEKINRPDPSLKIDKIVDGVRKFTESFDGQIWLEIMLVEGINDRAELDKIAQQVAKLNVDRIQLNTVVRPPAEKYAHPIDEEQMQKIKEKLGHKTEVIANFDRIKEKVYLKDIESKIFEMLQRRPATITDISDSLSLHKNEAVKQIAQLEKEGSVKQIVHRGERYYRDACTLR